RERGRRRRRPEPGRRQQRGRGVHGHDLCRPLQRRLTGRHQSTEYTGVVPRYDIPKAAPEPLRRVQLFVNSVDLSHGREWIADWLEREGIAATGAAVRRAQEVREALRELLYE